MTIKKYKRKTKRSGKKRTIKKSKKNNNTAYFEFRSGSSRKFWRIVKNGSKLTTHYGKIGTLGQMTTKDYGSKVDQTFESLVKSKKKKGYVEKTDFGDQNPKPPSAVEREYMKICRKAENNERLNPNRINYDCEGMLDQGEAKIKWQTQWYKDALKKGDFDWDKYNEYSKSKRKKKKSQMGGALTFSTKRLNSPYNTIIKGIIKEQEVDIELQVHRDPQSRHLTLSYISTGKLIGQHKCKEFFREILTYYFSLKLPKKAYFRINVMGDSSERGRALNCYNTVLNEYGYGYVLQTGTTASLSEEEQSKEEEQLDLSHEKTHEPGYYWWKLR